MKKFLLSMLLIPLVAAVAMADGLNVDDYQQFLNDNLNMDRSQFYEMYPVNTYYETISKPSPVKYLDLATEHFDLSPDHLNMINQYGFVVTEMKYSQPYFSYYAELWHADLPIFISADAFLHVLHRSYDNILMSLEEQIIIPRLDDMLDDMLARYESIASQYAEIEVMEKPLQDYYVFLTVAKNLLNDNWPEGQLYSEELAKIKQLIAGQQLVSYPMFSSTIKAIDFSQFTVRGHYTQRIELSNYFKSMMWLGRMAFYLINPKTDGIPPQTDEDLQRQTIGCYLLEQGYDESGADENFMLIEDLIVALVGESDNVQFKHLSELASELGITSPTQFGDLGKVEEFRDLLAQKPYASQKILSQVLFTNNPYSAEKIQPPSSFMFMGQRFILDSYIFANLVNDKIPYRMLPQPYDILYVLGNNDAAHFLQADLAQYDEFPGKLAALRYLVDSYGDDYWDESFYSSWLQAIRALNPGPDQSPTNTHEFMTTAAWQQKNMVTQLASWAELRHDNLLYAKQSYSGGITCSTPDAFLEPVPKFFGQLARLADNAIEIFDSRVPEEHSMHDGLVAYFTKFKEYSEKMQGIAQRELSGAVTDEDQKFLCSIYQTYSQHVGCGAEEKPDGWFADMHWRKDEIDNSNVVIADVHTSPTDENGIMVGWVMHVGTAPLEMAIITTKDQNGDMAAYCGPVSSFRSVVTTNFKRLTDEEWQQNFGYNNPLAYDISRPEISLLYSTDMLGQRFSDEYATLPTKPSAVEEPDIPVAQNPSANYPNPFTNSTSIYYRVPLSMSNADVRIEIFSSLGQPVRVLMDSKMQPGNYSTAWNGTDTEANVVEPGIYLYRINIDGKEVATGKLVKSAK